MFSEERNSKMWVSQRSPANSVDMREVSAYIAMILIIIFNLKLKYVYS